MTLLPEVEHALLDAVARDQAARRRTRLARIRARSLRLPAFALLALLGTTTIALAASGVILTGSNVPSQSNPRPGYRFGVPAPGRSKLLPLRAPDPAGGLPWGMRIIDTTRGYLCVELGRVDDGRLGELGIDGAFHDDGLFHPLPVDALPQSSGFGSDMVCVPPGQMGFATTIIGVEPSATGRPSDKADPRASLREVSFGLLGEHARRITYRSEDGTKSAIVLPGLGAYLIVRRATHGGQIDSLRQAPVAARKPVVNTIGALTSIAYSFGKRSCTVTSRNGNAEAECGLPKEGPPPKPKPLPVVHEHPHVQLVVHDHTITAAYLVFRAPYAVTSAGETYYASSEECRDSPGGEGNIDRDAAKGATLDLSIASYLSDPCSRPVKIKLYYVRSIDDLPVPTLLATVTVHIPRGDHVRALSRRVRQRLRKRH